MPPCGEPNFDRTLSSDAEALAKDWIAHDEKDGSNAHPPSVDISKWTSPQKVCFLDAMLSGLENRSPLKLSTIKSMKELYKFHETKNCEILFRFCMIGVSSSDEDLYPVVVRFITTQGRMKYVRPLYRALFATESGKQIAVQTFLDNKDFYHPIAAKMLAGDLGATVSEESNETESESKACTIFGIPFRTFIIGTTAIISIGALLLMKKRR